MASKQPQPRFLHATTGAGQKFYVWGGHGGHSAKIQTTTFECFDVCTESWQQPQVFRSSHYGMAVASDGESAYTFGGETDSDYVCTLYKVDLHSYQCKEIIPANPSDAPKRSRSGMVYYDQQLVIHGGYDGQEPTDELNVFDLEKKFSAESVGRNIKLTRIEALEEELNLEEFQEQRVEVLELIQILCNPITSVH